MLWTTPAEAQRFRWWQDERFIRELSLTADQIQRLEAVFQGAQSALRAQQRALSKLEDELGKIVDEGRVEESEVEHFAGKVEAARAELAKMRTVMIYRFRRILSADQHTKLERLFDQHEKERRGKPRGK